MSNVALVTGGTRGIGYGIAEKLAESGFDLALNGMRTESEVRGALEKLKSHRSRVVYSQGNIGDSSDRKRIVSETQDRLGPVNVLVNNAGVAPRTRKDILEMEEEDFDYVVDINLKGTFFLTQDVARSMIAEKTRNREFGGCIITVTSISAIVASLNRGEYCISNAGLSMMTQLMAARLGEIGIPVYEIRPGIIDTDMTAGVHGKYEKLIREGLTVDPRWGTPDDVGTVVASLARGDLPYGTGNVINVDGGMLVRRL